ncbi:spirocyclase AveC family protein [Streptomyces sp. NPDC127084]|uniref:spirocyclase AveC family protein n=1 Tax=Streptomyces sp. NPDC127084 TaxID=3347133 RepID=UPI0036520497
MAQASAPAASGSTAPGGDRTPAGRWRCPIVWWAVFGAACLVFQAVVFGRWIAAGDAHPHSSGGYTIPYPMKIATHVGQATVGLLFLVLAVMLWQECRRQGRITLKAAVFTGYCFSFWSGPYVNQFHYAAASNRYDLNVETWGPYLPGWRGDTPAIESFLMEMAYPVMLVWFVIALAVARLITRRRPHWTPRRTLAATTLVMLVCEPILTGAYQRLGGFAYPRALPGTLTLFEGQWYQLPVTSTLAVVGLFIVPALAMALHAGEDREVHLFRGCEQLPRLTRAWARLIAGVGLINAGTLGFQAVMALASLVSHPIDLPSWWDRPIR